MKRIWFYWIAGLIGFLAFACSDDKGTQEDTERLKVIEIQTTEATGEPFIVFTGEDIVSYNPETGKLTLKNKTGLDILNSMSQEKSLSSTISFYLDDKLLFNSLLVNPVSSNIYDELSLYAGNASQIYLTFGYPWGKGLHMSDHEYHLQQREANAQKIQAEWDQFMEYLEATGKIIK